MWTEGDLTEGKWRNLLYFTSTMVKRMIFSKLEVVSVESDILKIKPYQI
jgi:hypothetical protein